MKKLIVILLCCIPLTGWGQIGQWDSTQAIIYPTPTTGKIPLSATDTIYMINIEASDSGISYINRQSPVQLIYDFTGDASNDTIPASCLFQNFDFDSLIYSRVSEMTINADSTMQLPQRITEIEVYSTPTDRVSYFDVPFSETATMVIVPTDAATLQGANTAASAGDTVIIKSGTYNVNNYLTLSKGVTWIAVGAEKIVNNSGQGQCIFVNADNVALSNLNVEANNSTYGIYIGVKNNTKINNCRISGVTNSCVLLLGNNSGKSSIEYNLFDNEGASQSHIRYRNTNMDLIANRFLNGNNLTILQNDSPSDTDFRDRIYYNTILNDVSAYQIASISNSKYLDAKYNIVRLDYGQRFVVYGAGNAIDKFLNISYNNWMVDSTLDNLGFLKLGDTLKYYHTTIQGNYIKIDVDAINALAIYVYSACDINILDNTIIFPRNGLTGIQANTVNHDSVTITIDGNTNYIRECIDGAQGYNVYIVNPDNTSMDYNVVITNNDFKMPLVWHPEGPGGHANIYFYNVKKSYIAYNSIKGGQICGMHYKGQNDNSSAGFECESTDFELNIVDSTNVLIKGCRNVNVLNNTIVNSFNDDAVRVFSNQDAGINDDAAYCTVKNNLIYQPDVPELYPLFVGTSADTVGLELSNNLYYGRDSVDYAGTKYTFTEFSATGVSPNSYYTNPNLKSLLLGRYWPVTQSDAIGNANTSLLSTRLSTSSTWPDNVVQVSDNSTIGAYTFEDITPPVNVKYKGEIIRYGKIIRF